MNRSDLLKVVRSDGLDFGESSGSTVMGLMLQARKSVDPVLAAWATRRCSSRRESRRTEAVSLARSAPPARTTSACAETVGQCDRELFDRRRFKKQSRRQRLAERLLDARDELHEQERVPAKVEEIVDNANRRDADHVFPVGASSHSSCDRGGTYFRAAAPSNPDFERLAPFGSGILAGPTVDTSGVQGLIGGEQGQLSTAPGQGCQRWPRAGCGSARRSGRWCRGQRAPCCRRRARAGRRPVRGHGPRGRTASNASAVDNGDRQIWNRYRPPGRVLQREHDLEQGIAARVARRLQRFDELFKRDVLVGECVDGDLPDLAQQRAEGGVAGDLGAQDEHVDEKADQRFQLGACAPGDRRPDDEVGLAGIAVEQGVKRRQQRHEERGAFVAAEGAECFDQRRRELQGVHGAGKGLLRRPREVGRQVERGEGGEPPTPVVQLAMEPIPLQLLALPEREIGILQGEFGQR